MIGESVRACVSLLDTFISRVRMEGLKHHVLTEAHNGVSTLAGVCNSVPRDVFQSHVCAFIQHKQQLL